MRERKPSATAELIAQSAVFLSRDPRLAPVLPDRAAALSEAFLAATDPGKLAVTRLLSRRGLRWVIRTIERGVLPGIQLHYAARKRFIEAAARSFLEAGGTQLVVLGAGFDTLALRLTEERADVLCVELDHPATQEAKRRALSESIPRNLKLSPVNLATTPLIDALGGVFELKRSMPTFFVLEGVTMYLSEDAVLSTLRTCAEFGGPGSQVAWTFMSPDANGRIAFRRSGKGIVDAWLAAKDEPFSWGISPDRLDAFLATASLRPIEVAEAALLRARFLEPLGIEDPLAEGEAICLCERP